ncbi:hypothetical protein [Nitrospirillum sp. BR 11164]
MLQAAAIYIQAYEMITGETYVPAREPDGVLARIRRNLSQYF